MIQYIFSVTTITVMTNATVKMIENYKDADPNFTLARQHEHHKEEQEQLEKLRKVSKWSRPCLKMCLFAVNKSKLYILSFFEM